MIYKDYVITVKGMPYDSEEEYEMFMAGLSAIISAIAGVDVASSNIITFTANENNYDKITDLLSAAHTIAAMQKRDKATGL